MTRHFDAEAHILDIGCGTAWLARHFTHYAGVDIDADVVARGQNERRNVLQCDADEPLPFADDTFDGVVLKDVLEHIGDPVGLVREVRRVLRPGGVVFASSPDAQRWVWDDYRHRRPFTRKAYRLLFDDHGFEVAVVGYETVLPGASIVSARTRSNRRPLPMRALARVPGMRRNVWLLARRPAVT